MLLLALLVAGCSSADVNSLADFLIDLGVPPEQAAQIASRMQEVAVQRAGEALQQGQAQVEDLASQVWAQVRDFRLALPREVRIGLIVVGAILLLVGGRLYKAAVAAPGFALGMVIGISVLDLAPELPDAWVLVIAAVIGLVGAGLALAVHDLAVLLIGALVSGFLVVSLLVTYNVAFSPVFAVIVAVCAIAGAVGLLMIAKRMPTFMAAILGAVLVSIGMVENLNLVIIVPLALVGLGVQGIVRWLRRERKPREPKPGTQTQARPAAQAQPPAYQPSPPAYPSPPPAQSAFPPLGSTGQPRAAQAPTPQVFPPLGASEPPRRGYNPAETPPRSRLPVEWLPEPPYDQPTPPEQPSPAWTPQPPSDQPTPPESMPPATDRTLVARVEEPPLPSGATLTLASATGPARTVVIEPSPFTIGGNPGCHLALPGLAPTHATIQTSAAGYFLQSHVSPTQTRVNGRPARATYLAHGDVLTLGEYQLRFNWPPAASLPSPGDMTVLDR